MNFLIIVAYHICLSMIILTDKALVLSNVCQYTGRTQTRSPPTEPNTPTPTEPDTTTPTEPDTPTTTEPSGCYEDGVYYQAYTTYKTGNCTEVYCNAKDGNTNVDITFTCCEFDGNIYQIEEQFELQRCTMGICQVNGVVEFFPKCCLYDEKEYEFGKYYKIDDCTELECSGDGEAQLAIACCSMPECDYPVDIPGQCCDVCPDE